MVLNDRCLSALGVTVLVLCVICSPLGLCVEEQPAGASPVRTDPMMVSLDVKDADVRDVLRALALQADASLAVTEAVKGRVTIRLRDARWDQAFDAVVKAGGLVSKQDADFIIVMMPSEAKPRAKETPESPKLDTRVFVFEYATPKAAQEALRAQLSSYGTVTVDEQADSVIVSDVRENLEELASVAALIDAVPGQVIIDALIADTIVRDEKDIGVDWEVGRTHDNNELSLTQDLLDPGLGGTITFELSNRWSVSTLVRALEQVQNVRILASPRILVVSGREASIETIEELPFQQLTQTSEGGQIGTTAFKEAGVKLRVTPRIMEDGRILLLIWVEQSAATGESMDQIPIISTRKAETTLILHEGETVIIGGLRRTDRAKTVRRIPVLGNVPLLGFLFRYKTMSVENRDLVIFLTPHLVAEPVLSKTDEELHRGHQEELEGRDGGSGGDVTDNDG